MKVLVWSRWLDDILFNRKSPDGVGGAEMQLAYWAYLLSRQSDFDVYTFGRRFFYLRNNEYRINFLFYPWVRFVGVLWKNLKYYYLRKLKPDVVIIRDRHELTGYFQASKNISAQVIFMMASNSGLDNLSNELIDAIKKVNIVVLQNQYQYDRIHRFVDKENILTLHSLFIPELFSVNKTADIYELDFIFVGNLRSVKRPEWFFDLVKMKPSMSFGLIGNCSDDKYAKQLINLKALNNFHYFGYLSMEDVLPVISKSRVLILTSIYEGYPNVYLQAKYYGLSIVGTIDPLEELNNQNGRYFVKSFDSLLEYSDYALDDHKKGLVSRVGPNNNDIYNRLLDKL